MKHRNLSYFSFVVLSVAAQSYFANAQYSNAPATMNAAANPFVLQSYSLGQNTKPDAELNKCIADSKNANPMKPPGGTNYVDLVNAGAELSSSIATAAAGGYSNAINSGIAGGMNAFNSTQNCEGSLDFQKYNSCEDPDLLLNKKFSKQKFEKAIAQIQEIQKKASCQFTQNKLASAFSGCFQNYFEALKDDMAKVRDSYVSFKELGEQYITSVDQKIEETNQLMGTVDTKLNSLKQMKAQLEGAKNALNGVASSGDKANIGSVAGLQQRLNDFKNQASSFESSKRKYSFKKTADCIKGLGAADSQFSQCQKSDTENYPIIECIAMLKGNELLGKLQNGSSHADNMMKNKAASEKTQALAVMNGILREFYSGVPRFDDVNQLLAAKRSDLSRLGSFAGSFQSELQKCDTETQSLITAELEDQSIQGGLGQQKAAIDAVANSVGSEMGNTLSKLNSVIQDSVSELSKGSGGSTGGFSTSNCISNTVLSNNQVTYKNTDLNSQMQCIQSVRATITQMLDGTGAIPGAPPVKISLGFADPKLEGMGGQTNPIVECYHYNDCVAKADIIKTHVSEKLMSLEGSGTFTDSKLCAAVGGTCMGKKAYIQKANTMIRQSMQVSANDFANRVATARANLEGLKNILAPWGIHLDVAKKEGRMSAEKGCPKSDTEICSLPEDFDTLLSDISGVPNVGKDQFKEVVTTAENNIKKAEPKISEATEAIHDLKDLMATCEKKEKDSGSEKAVNKKMGEINKIIAQCKRKARLGGATKPILDSKIEQLVDAVQDICQDAPNGSTLEGCSNIADVEEAGADECLAVYKETQRNAEIDRSIASQRQGSADSTK